MAQKWHKIKSPASQGFDQQLMLAMLAEWTGLEPATPGLTGRYSNQLNYHSYKTVQHSCLCALVGAERLELPTFAL